MSIEDSRAKVTRHKLVLGPDRDSTTGWYDVSYTESTIEAIIQDRGTSTRYLPAGAYVKLDALGMTADPVVEGDKIEKSPTRFYEVKTVQMKYWLDSFVRRDCDLTLLPLHGLTGGTYTPSSVEDARYRTRDYLEGWTNPDTALNPDNLPSFIIAYGFPSYPLTRVFKTKGVDLVFSIGEPNSIPKVGHDQKTYGYEEHVPVTPCCIDKSNISGTELLQQARTELRRITETYPLGSLREPVREEPETERLGSTVLYKYTFWLDYLRNTA